MSDHKPLEQLNLKSRTDEELGDIVYYLSQFDFTIKYMPGPQNKEADALFRNPVLQSFEETSDTLKIVNLLSLEEIKTDQDHVHEEFPSKENLLIRLGKFPFLPLQSKALKKDKLQA
ncbi:hypothetical protein RUM43_015080 [Polyplax serrata]|uniref:Reverse transcriptase RNase H-like domain-containing protein n=1 Tax=Polyplax serrata TaxID=468196 RepID=A0AAN8PSJ3_POLSC